MQQGTEEGGPGRTYQDYLSCPRHEITVDAGAVVGPLELWRHTLGHGGINRLPLPDRVVTGVKSLQPRLVRIFLQEFFNIYPDHGKFDWSRLDPYMESFARTGARVVAAITIKPKILFPNVDARVWRPNDKAEWQRVISELVKRYSVDKPIVTYWEIGNEPDIGESGGCPYLIADPKDYVEFYTMTIEPILRAFPKAKVGGPATCWVENQPLPGLVEHCRRTGTRLDFVSWHVYDDAPGRHVAGVEKARALLADFPGSRPEMLVTEMNKSFDPVSLEDLAFQPRRAAALAALILAMVDAGGPDWTFYYHIWDQTFYRDDFRGFFSPGGIDGIMTTHWNEVPHRFGLFGVSGEVRPQYFVYKMLARMGDQRIAARSGTPDVRVLAARRDGRLAVLLVDYSPRPLQDKVLTVRFTNLTPGRKMQTVYRIDSQQRWDRQELELLPLERREVDTATSYYTQVYCPADSVILVALEDLK